MTAPKPGDPLTAQELRALGFVADGLMNSEVGRRMHLAEDTVKTHIRRAFVKLGARDRANAVWLACQQGLLGGAPVPVPPPAPVAAPVLTVAPSVLAELVAVAEAAAAGRPSASFRGQATRALTAMGRAPGQRMAGVR